NADISVNQSEDNDESLIMGVTTDSDHQNQFSNEADEVINSLTTQNFIESVILQDKELTIDTLSHNVTSGSQTSPSTEQLKNDLTDIDSPGASTAEYTGTTQKTTHHITAGEPHEQTDSPTGNSITSRTFDINLIDTTSDLMNSLDL